MSLYDAVGQRSRAIIVIILLFISIQILFAVTFFGENFNSIWSTTNPPASWRIAFTGDTSINDWHRKAAYQSPWSANSTPYACLIGRQTSGDSPDSLISPVIDCSNYYNIVLRCSTYFSPLIGSYQATLFGSIDGGLSWSYEIRNYTNQNVPPQLEVFDLPWARSRPLVRFAWVFEGEPAGLGQWSLDNVSLTGYVVQDTDIATLKIIRPKRFELPGTIPLIAEFANVSRYNQVNVPVGCEIMQLPDSNIIYFVTDIIPIIYSGDTIVDTLSTLWTVGNGIYQATFLCDVVGDQNQSNDTLSRIFTVGFKDEQGYDDGVTVGDSSWVWERYGWGVRFTNSLYLAYSALVESVKFHFPVSDTMSNHFRIRICDDDGTEGSPGTPLYESGILSTVSGWNSYDLSLDSIAIWDSSFYLFFIQVEGQPLSPLLSRDAARNNETSYWACCDTNYVQDFTDGDWMFRCVLNYAFEMPRPLSDDFRTVFIESPEENLVVRPSNRTFLPQARIENWGNLPQVNVPVVCSIISISNPGLTPYVSTRIVDLNTSSDTILSFRTWEPTFRGHGKVTVRTLLANDMNPTNDVKVETILVQRSGFIGQDSSVFDYRWIDSDTINGPIFSWIDTSGWFYREYQGDEQTHFMPLTYFAGFTFRFYDITYQSIWVSDNGWIKLGPDTGYAPPGYPNNSAIPDPMSPNNTIYAFWDDLAYGTTVGGGGIFYKVIGNAPNRKFVVIYQDVRRNNAPNSDPLTFEVILSENGAITMQYQDVFCSDARYNYGRSATIGIEDFNGEYGLQYLYGEGGCNNYYPGNMLSQGRAIRIYSSFVGIEENRSPLTAERLPLKIYPNPFKQITNIRYALTQSGKISLKIYDITGKLVRNLFDGFQKTGIYIINWNGTDDSGMKLPAGVYLYSLKTSDGAIKTKEIIIMR